MEASSSSVMETAVKLLKGRKSRGSGSGDEALSSLNTNAVANFGAYPAGDYEDYSNAKYDIGGGGGAGGAYGGGAGAGYAGYGNIERSSGYGHSGHGHHGYGHKKLECCELVVDPLTFASLLASIIGGTAFLNTVVTMVLGRKRRRRRSNGEGPLDEYLDVMKLGELQEIPQWRS